MSYLNHSLGGVSSDGLSSVSSTSGSLDGSGDGLLDLDVVLPDGRVKHLSVEARKPMMDLLVHIAGKCHLSPAGYTLQAYDPDTDRPLAYKPNSSIHSLGVTTLHFVSKKEEKTKPKKRDSTTKPFEVTQRLTVNLPRNQKHILRVKPELSLAEIFQMSCADKNLDPYKHELVHPTSDVSLNMASPLSAYGLNEITIILNTSASEQRLSSPGSLPSRQLSPESVSSTMPRSRKGSKKGSPDPQQEGAYMPGMQEKKKKGIFSIFSRKKGSKFTPEQAPPTNRMSMMATPQSRTDLDKSQGQMRPKSEYISPTHSEEVASSSSSLSPSGADTSAPHKPPRTKRQAPAPPPTQQHVSPDEAAQNGGQHLNHSRTSSVSSGGRAEVRSVTSPSLSETSPASADDTTLNRRKRRAPAPPAALSPVTSSPTLERSDEAEPVMILTEVVQVETQTNVEVIDELSPRSEVSVTSSNDEKAVTTDTVTITENDISYKETETLDEDDKIPSVSRSINSEIDNEHSVVIETSTHSEIQNESPADMKASVLEELKNVQEQHEIEPINEDASNTDERFSNKNPSTLSSPQPRPPCQFVAPPPPDTPPPADTDSAIGQGDSVYAYGRGLTECSKVEVAEHSTQVYVSFRNSLSSDPGSKVDLQSPVEQLDDLVEDSVDDDVIISSHQQFSEDSISDHTLEESPVDDVERTADVETHETVTDEPIILKKAKKVVEDSSDYDSDASSSSVSSSVLEKIVNMDGASDSETDTVVSKASDVLTSHKTFTSDETNEVLDQLPLEDNSPQAVDGDVKVNNKKVIVAGGFKFDSEDSESESDSDKPGSMYDKVRVEEKNEFQESIDIDAGKAVTSEVHVETVVPVAVAPKDNVAPVLKDSYLKDEVATVKDYEMKRSKEKGSEDLKIPDIPEPKISAKSETVTVVKSTDSDNNNTKVVVERVTRETVTIEKKEGDFKVPDIPLPKHKENSATYPAVKVSSHLRDHIKEEETSKTRKSPESRTDKPTKTESIKKQRERLSLVDLKANNPHTILALKAAKGPSLRKVSATNQNTVEIRSKETKSEPKKDEASRRKSAPPMGTFSIAAGSADLSKISSTKKPETIIIRKSDPLPVMHKKVQNQSHAGDESHAHVKNTRKVSSADDVKVEDDEVVTHQQHIGKKEIKPTHTYSQREKVISTSSPSLLSDVTNVISEPDIVTKHSLYRPTPAESTVIEPEPLLQPVTKEVTDVDRHRVSFWGPKPWNARNKSEPNMKDVKMALDIVRRFETSRKEKDHYDEKPSDFVEEKEVTPVKLTIPVNSEPVESGPGEDVVDAGTGEESIRTEFHEIVEKETDSSGEMTQTRYESHETFTHSPRIHHHGSLGSLTSHPLSLATEETEKSRSEAAATSKRTLQQQYDDLQKQFSKWQQQLRKNQAVIDRKMGSVTVDDKVSSVASTNKPPLERSASDAVTTDTRSHKNASSSFGEKSWGSYSSRRREGSPPRSSETVSRDSGSSRRRIIPPPSLDPREELMISIRNAGGRGLLRRVPQSETDW